MWIAIILLIGGCQRKANPPKNCAPGQIKVEENCTNDPNRVEVPAKSSDDPPGKEDPHDPTKDDPIDPTDPIDPSGSGSPDTPLDPSDNTQAWNSTGRYESPTYESDRYSNYNGEQSDYYDRSRSRYDDPEEPNVVDRRTDSFRDDAENIPNQEGISSYKGLEVYITLKATASPKGAGPMGLFMKLSKPELVSSISLQYLKGENIEGDAAFRPWDVYAVITFNVDYKICEVSIKKFDWESYRPSENTFGKLTPYLCKGRNN